VPLPDGVTATADARELPRDAALLVSAVPTPYLRDVLSRIADCLPAAPILSVTKGIENETLLRPSEVIGDVLGRARRVAVLSGPCIAFEVARRMPATVVVSSGDAALADAAQQALAVPWLRIYDSRDTVGVELGGALKNVVALAAGVLDGLGLGVNAKAALVTRGLVEITRLGVAMGAEAETFAGLAGLGDLVTTCVSPHGRNRSAGEAIGRGRSLDEVTEQLGGQVAEGVRTTRSAVALAGRHGVEMPITREVHRVLFDAKDPREAIRDLMARPRRAETDATQGPTPPAGRPGTVKTHPERSR
jgi:glycerol-3-phosphate dehydrogenase (NAD(P)+)